MDDERRHALARQWSAAAAGFLAVGAWLFLWGSRGLLLRLFALVLLAHGAKALWTAVEVQFGEKNTARAKLAKLMALEALVLITLAVAFFMR